MKKLTFSEVSSMFGAVTSHFGEGIATTDFNDDKPEKDTFEGPRVFSDDDLDDSLIGEEEYRHEYETSKFPVRPGPIEASLREERRSRRARLFLVLLCLCVGMLVLLFFLMTKPEEEEFQVVRERIKRPIESIQKQDDSSVPMGIKEEEKKDVQEVSVAEAEGAGAQIQPQEEEKIQVAERETTRPDMAMVETPTTLAVPEEKQPLGKYTINVASFRKRMRAERFMNDLKKKGYNAFVSEVSIPQRGTWYRVSVGHFPSVEDARIFGQELQEKEKVDFFVRKLKDADR